MAQKDQNVESNITELSIRAIVTKHRIRWTVKNVSKVSISGKVSSQDFFLTSELTASISFKMDDANLWVYICNKSNTEVKVERKLALSDCSNTKLYEESDTKTFLLKKGEEVDMIGSVSNRRTYDTLPNDILIIDLYLSLKETEGKEIANPFEYDTDSIRKLKGDFKTMLENPVNPDVTLQVGDERIPAHWSVLCSRSPYFQKMFDSQMQERVQNSVTITDVTVSSLKKLVEFLYTASFIGYDKDDNIEELFDLYYAADKYELMDLRSLCARNIEDNTTANNVSQILQLAQRHNDDDLKKHAMRFIELHSDTVFQADSWRKFETAKPLAAAIFKFWLKKN